MKTFKALLSLAATIGLTWALNTRLPLSAPVPPLGKFLDPFHGFWQNCFADGARENLNLEGLSGPVEVIYDSAHIPHIYAANEEDLFLAQGFVTASDRLWQMEFQTHAAAGRVSELLGIGKDSAYLNYDRDQRRLGMVMAATNFLTMVEADPEMNKLADKYTEGINHYISTLNDRTLPIEYKLLDYRPEPWTKLKIGLLLKSMARTLNTGDKDVEMTNALKLIGLEQLNLLFPDREQVTDPIVDKSGGWPKPVAADTVPLAVPDELVTMPASEKSDKDIGSNNWALSGSKTSTGAPLLCNDPHLTLSLPSIWYTIHLSAPGYNTMGASLPGSPGVITGFNDSIAWGVTNAQRDLVDWYRITFRDASMDEYLVDGEWRKTTKKVETFRVHGVGDYYDTIVMTHQGPIRFDRQFKGKSSRINHAYRWVSHDPSIEMRTFYHMNKARNLKDYHHALGFFSSPAQNFVFAAVNGDIAIRIQGKFPVRRPNEGRFVLDGSKSANEWRRYIPEEHLVRFDNPPRGFVSSANQYPADSTYPYYITATSYEAFRNRRINQRLAGMTKATIDDMKTMLMDSYSIKGAEAIPLLVNVLNIDSLNATEKKALEAVRNWDLHYTKDARGAGYFDTWWSTFHAMVWDEFIDQKPELPVPTGYQTIRLISDHPDLPWFDIRSTDKKETLADITLASFRKAVAAVQDWEKQSGKEATWSAYRSSTVDHLMRLGPLGRPLDSPGNRETINATGKRTGPSWRMVVSLEKTGVKAWGVYPGGQSGNPASRYYDNMIPLWETGEFVPLEFSPREAVNASTAFTLQPNR